MMCVVEDHRDTPRVVDEVDRRIRSWLSRIVPFQVL